jgi:polar amino acid transport system substrate-binding protein
VNAFFRSALVLLVGLTAVATRADEPEKGRSVAPAAKALVICGVPASMPRTDRTPDGKPRGLDAEVAERVARVLGRPVEFHWCAGPECSWRCLPEGRCDIVAGQPVDSGPARGVAWSVAYAGARFALVIPREGANARSLDDLRGKRVGIVAGTVALAEKDHAIARFRTREALLDGFAEAKLDAAFLDGDFAAWYLHEHPKLPLRLVEAFVPRERWNMALAVRAGDAELLVAVNRALAQLAESGELRKVYERYGVPFHAPFTPADRRAEAPDTWRKIQARGELVVTMDPANLPYSSAREDRAGLDVELARALADRMHLKLRLDWLDIHRETAIGELIQGRCDLAMGEAVEPDAVADDEPLAGKVIYSRPYYRTGYVLVRRKDGPRVASVAELKGGRSQRLGTEAGSVADYRLRQRGYLRRLYRNQLAALKATADGDIDFAYLWANAGWTLHASPDLDAKLEVAPGADPVDRWDIAVAMRHGDIELKRRVDAALGALVDDGTVARLLARYHLPDPGGVGGAARHKAGVDLRKVHTSKHPYDAMARIRSAGELVVGLDQNNLPFSSAHPSPSGLDHEIARLLAERLGVSLRVYWAVAAHDSYPSKLASKQVCDVILGITPDDRFTGRVLYSRPYHVARYRVFVRSGEGPPDASVPIAVERGIAVRGLEGRAKHEYPSTEAVLEAVATGRERGGYAIATRGAWLAHQRWPGKLELLPATGDDTKSPSPKRVSREVEPPGEPVLSGRGARQEPRPPTSGIDSDSDAFPIVAAVRKSDRELKDAIDRAWDELDRSGQLARAFARWSIPHEPARK